MCTHAFCPVDDSPYTLMIGTRGRVELSRGPGAASVWSIWFTRTRREGTGLLILSHGTSNAARSVMLKRGTRRNWLATCWVGSKVVCGHQRPAARLDPHSRHEIVITVSRPPQSQVASSGVSIFSASDCALKNVRRANCSFKVHPPHILHPPLLMPTPYSRRVLHNFAVSTCCPTQVSPAGSDAKPCT